MLFFFTFATIINLTKHKMSKIFYLLIALTSISSCGLENMIRKYKTANFITTPATLQTHGGKVALSLDATFAEKYFDRKATIDFTPCFSLQWW